MGAACSSICVSKDRNDLRANVLDGCTSEVRLLAWMRRRSGPDCDFGQVYVELFGKRDPVNANTFARVLQEHGFTHEPGKAFDYIDRHLKRESVGADAFESWQVEVEKKEAEGLKQLRDFLKDRYSNPGVAFKEMGKGEGDVLSHIDFCEGMKKIGFVTDCVADGDRLQELFRFIDKDCSGDVTFSEFKSIMKAVGKGLSSPGRASPRDSRRRSSSHDSPRVSPRRRSVSESPRTRGESEDKTKAHRRLSQVAGAVNERRRSMTHDEPAEAMMAKAA